MKKYFIKIFSSLTAVCLLHGACSSKLIFAGQTTGCTASVSAPTSGTAFIRGIEFDASDPFNFELIIDQEGGLTGTGISAPEKEKMFRYFLTALTIPEDKLWVNLSPYEKNRILDDTLAATEIGEVLLEQDYLLKQLSASLTHPDTPSGRAYWDAITDRKDKDVITQSRNHLITDSDLSRIWIKPDRLCVYDTGNIIFITDMTLKVETENMQELIPAITQEVNSGSNFAPLRQMVHSILLAQCFKRKFADALYSFYYNAENTAGLELSDPALKDQVFKRYVESFKNGTYDVTGKVTLNGRRIKKRYTSGGISSAISDIKQIEKTPGWVLRENFSQQEFIRQKIQIKIAALAADEASSLEEYIMTIINKEPPVSHEELDLLIEFIDHMRILNNRLSSREKNICAFLKKLLHLSILSYGFEKFEFLTLFITTGAIDIVRFAKSLLTRKSIQNLLLKTLAGAADEQLLYFLSYIYLKLALIEPSTLKNRLKSNAEKGRKPHAVAREPDRKELFNAYAAAVIKATDEDLLDTDFWAFLMDPSFADTLSQSEYSNQPIIKELLIMLNFKRMLRSLDYSSEEFPVLNMASLDDPRILLDILSRVPVFVSESVTKSETGRKLYELIRQINPDTVTLMNEPDAAIIDIRDFRSEKKDPGSNDNGPEASSALSDSSVNGGIELIYDTDSLNIKKSTTEINTAALPADSILTFTLCGPGEKTKLKF